VGGSQEATAFIKISLNVQLLLLITVRAILAQRPPPSTGDRLALNGFKCMMIYSRWMSY